MKKSILCAIVVLSSFFSTVAVAQADLKVIEGTHVVHEASVSRSMAYIRFGGWVCSAVVISPRHLLTAGHCVSGSPKVEKIQVYLGAKKHLGPRVSRYKLHPDYGKEGGYLRGDLAVIRLAEPLGPESRIAVLNQESIVQGTTLTMAGFGFSNAQRTKIGTLLQSQSVFGQTAVLHRNPFSDGTRRLGLTGPRALCSGDSGGATFVSTAAGLRVVGIHSMSDCHKHSTDIYAPDHLPWIRSMLAL